MSISPVFVPPPFWTNQPVRLYHGTIDPHARTISSSGVRISFGRVGADFGPGFYTTTIERQARSWAWQLAGHHRGTARIVYADVDREALTRLDCLAFVRGDFDADDFWSLVVHCRRGGTDHARLLAGKRRYDMVIGPVAAIWRQRLLIAGADQISFHTSAAEAVLNSISWSILP